jgi:hypothetical protein
MPMLEKIKHIVVLCSQSFPDHMLGFLRSDQYGMKACRGKDRKIRRCIPPVPVCVTDTARHSTTSILIQGMTCGVNINYSTSPEGPSTPRL